MAIMLAEYPSDRKSKKSFKLLRRQNKWHHRLDAKIVVCVLYPLSASIATISFSSAKNVSGISFWVWGTLLGTVMLSFLAFILPFWSLPYCLKMCFIHTGDVKEATHCLVIPSKPTRRAAIAEIFLEQAPRSDCEEYWERFIEYNRKKYQYDERVKMFCSLQYPTQKPLKFFVDKKNITGLTSEKVEKLQRYYGRNTFQIEKSSFINLYKQHVVAPFFLFQLFCVLLWLMDEYWSHALITLIMLMCLEGQVVSKRLKELNELEDLRIKPFKINVFRDKKWILVLTDELVPGDIVALNMASNTVDSIPLPCDLLLLEGRALVNESFLTGESIVQTKIALSVDSYNENKLIDVSSSNSQNILYADTKLTAVFPEKNTKGLVPRPPTTKNSITCYVLKTGFETSQGKIIKVVLSSGERVTAENKEAYLFLFLLLVFSVASSCYVFFHSPEPSNFKRLLTCILIIVSVLPPEFPIIMSMTVTLSLVELLKNNIYCTEPFRLPFAGKLTVCAFDKTGTLTSDTMVVQSVAGVEQTAGKDPKAPINQLPLLTTLVLVSCHSLAVVEENILGDSGEKAGFDLANWKASSLDLFVSRDGESWIKVMKRFPFVSELQRMTVVSAYSAPPNAGLFGENRNNSSDNKIHNSAKFPDKSARVKGFCVLSKGSPEIMRQLIESVPRNFEQTYQNAMKKGFRVLCLAGRKLDSEDDIKKDRKFLESRLEFAGFLILSSSIKKGTVETLRELGTSGHKIIMLTGDNPYTAMQVAKKSELVSKQLLTYENPTMSLLSDVTQEGHVVSFLCERNFTKAKRDEPCTLSDEEIIGSKACDVYCMTGNVLKQLKEKDYPKMSRLIERITVFARVSPAQKEYIVHKLSALKYIVLMCGDGSNDSRALKVSHVGVSLLAIREKRNEKPEFIGRKCFNYKGSSMLERLRSKLIKMKEEAKMEESLNSVGIASLASTFTSKGSSIDCATFIVKMGRATLSVVMMTYKMIGINSLLTAYSLSALALHGVKLGDLQTNVESIYVSFLTFAATRSKPASKITSDRPADSIFTPYILLSIFGQSGIHICCLYFSKKLAMEYTLRDMIPDPQDKFEPNLVNTVIYTALSTAHAATFLANYEGYPFTRSLKENKVLLRGLIIFFITIILLTFEVFPDFNEFLNFELYPNMQFKQVFFMYLLLDATSSWALGQFCYKCSMTKITDTQ